MATSVEHSGFKRLLDRDQAFSTTDSKLAILIEGQEAMAFKKDSVGTYGLTKIGYQPTETLAGIIDGYGVSLATGYSASGTNRIYAFEVNADTGSTDVTGDTNIGAIKGRVVIGTTQTNCGTSAIVGTVDVGTVNIISNYNGLCGVVDFYGNCTVGGSVSHIAALTGVVWNEATTTLNSAGGCVAGLDLVQNSGSPTLTAGINPAVYIRASASSRWEWTLYATDVINGININCPALTATDGRLGKFTGTQATPNMTDGYGSFEVELTVTGTATGQINAASTWINLGTSAVVPGYMAVHTDGIYDGTATLTGSYISWSKYTCMLASNPSWCSLFELNFDGANSEIDAMFNCNNYNLALGYQAGTPTKAAVGSIPFCSNAGGGLRYIYLYDAADSD